MLSRNILIILKIILIVSADINEVPLDHQNVEDIAESPRMIEILSNILQNQKDVNHDGNGRFPFIIGGRNAALGQFPYHVRMIMKMSEDGKAKQYLCGGSLINTTWVLTAAHCVYGNLIDVTLYFGIVNAEEPRGEAIVKKNKITIHPKYNDDTLANDIAMINIDKIQTNEFVNLIQLPKNHKSLDFSGKILTVSGFGRISDFSQNTSQVLKYANLNVIPNAQCAKNFNKGAVLDTNICTASSMTDTTCSGDSGGPLAYDQNKIIIGVVSFSAKKSCTGYPAGYTRVTKYIDWIEKVMNSAPKTFSLNITLTILLVPLALFMLKH